MCRLGRFCSPPKTVILPLFIACLSFLNGCGGKASAVLTEGSKVGYIKDVPVPVEFKMNESESHSKSLPDRNIRDIDYVFGGTPHKMATKRFFEKQMPLYRWTQTSSTVALGRIQMLYIKDEEECQISLEKLGLFGGTRLSISIEGKKK